MLDRRENGGTMNRYDKQKQRIGAKILRREKRLRKTTTVLD